MDESLNFGAGGAVSADRTTSHGRTAEGAVSAGRDPADDADFAALTERIFGLAEKDWTQYSPLTLAWIGDTVFDMVIRTVLVKKANKQTEKLHREATALVNARAQAQAAEKLLPSLTEEEAAIYRRGRNADPHHNAKNAGRTQYLEATGFETLIGWLYLEKRNTRILELVREAYPDL